MNQKNKVGRPKTKEARRNFSLCSKADSFLVGESRRTGRPMTAMVEDALMILKSMSAKERDTITSELRKGA